MKRSHLLITLAVSAFAGYYFADSVAGWPVYRSVNAHFNPLNYAF